MDDCSLTASSLFGNAQRLIEAYHTILQPLCRETGLPPMAIDMLMYFANNPENSTAKDICQFRGLKAGIVSVHVDRLVKEGLLTRQSVPGDRRKTQLLCTPAAESIVAQGRELQQQFADKLLDGISDADIAAFRKCLAHLSGNIDKIRKNGATEGGK